MTKREPKAGDLIAALLVWSTASGGCPIGPTLQQQLRRAAALIKSQAQEIEGLERNLKNEAEALLRANAHISDLEMELRVAGERDE